MNLEEYKNLNSAQKEAVDTIEGPVMVIAGPGTGKTSILTLRIANIIDKTDISPENILALTFTESGAYAMRKKLVSLIGTAGYKVNINTFHGFCNDVIKSYPERFPRIIGSSAITDIDQIGIMEKIIETNDFNLLKPYGDTLFYVKPALNEIKNLKREAISVEDFLNIVEKQNKDFESIPDKIHEKGAHKGKTKGEYIKLKERIEKNRELLKLYSKYEDALVENKYYDFEDMIIEVIKTLKKDEDLLLMLQESYQYILADEHQDANNSQNKILELLSNFHKNPNLFIVGDEKQAIFRFQGASIENFLYFKKMYPEAKLINLEENYRSTQNILDAAHSLIVNNRIPEENKKIVLKSNAQNNKELIHIIECKNSNSENEFLVKSIKDKIDKKENIDEIAVLYRDNKDAFPIASAFEKAGIPFKIESESDVLKDMNIRKILMIFESINDISNEEKLGKILFIDFFKLPIIDIYKALENTRKEKIKLIDVLSRDFSNFTKMILSWASCAHNKTLVELFEIVVRESGYLEYSLSNTNSLEMMTTLEIFFGELKKISGTKKEYFLKDFVEHLDMVREHGILTRTGKVVMKKGVRLMTAHKSKGLEFDSVYIVGACDGHWGNKSKRRLFHPLLLTEMVSSADNDIDDERRLFYVALTRARKIVYITYSKENEEGREQMPTQFINEISDEYKKIDTIDSVFDTKSLFGESVVHENHEINNKEYLQKLFLDQGLSVTSLNNYLKCPWEYFFINLIRLPRAQSKHQMYGTAVHETLKVFFDKYKNEESLGKEDLLNLFEFNLNKTFLSHSEYLDSLKKGKQALNAYFDRYNNTWTKNLLTEYNIKGVHLELEKFTLLLKGQLDKIEFINERDVNVVDYKTGKKKSDHKENYQRQLIFYKLLLNLDDKKRYNMISGELDFIEPDNKGKFTKDKYEISDDEVENLRKLIEEKAMEIYSLSFWNNKCEDKECEYCKLGESLKRV